MDFDITKAVEEYITWNPKSTPKEAFLDGLALGLEIGRKVLKGDDNG